MSDKWEPRFQQVKVFKEEHGHWFSWEERFQQLKEFKEKHGHCDVPARYPGGLGDWLSHQRTKRERSQGSDARQTQRLEELGVR